MEAFRLAIMMLMGTNNVLHKRRDATKARRFEGECVLEGELR